MEVDETTQQSSSTSKVEKGASTKSPPKIKGPPFTLKKWNAVAMWQWDVECDTCAICRVQVMGKHAYCVDFNYLLSYLCFFVFSFPPPPPPPSNYIVILFLSSKLQTICH